jgi:hypothetical protein
MSTNTTVNYVGGNKITTTTSSSTKVTNHSPIVRKSGLLGARTGITTTGTIIGARGVVDRSVRANRVARPLVGQTVTSVTAGLSPGVRTSHSREYTGPILNGQKTTVPLNQRNQFLTLRPKSKRNFGRFHKKQRLKKSNEHHQGSAAD